MTDPQEERENPLIEKEVTISETLHKSVKVETDDYYLYDMYRDEDGLLEYDADFYGTDWLQAYKNEHSTLEQLLDVVPKFLGELLPTLQPADRARAEYLIKECNGWLQDEVEVVTD